MGQQGTNIFLRGLGSSGNNGFEQTVGMYIDGIYFGQNRQYRGSLFDLERVEVLRGPQSTLFGKNTIAGAINVTSAVPSNEFEALISTSYGSYNEIDFTGVVSGPLSEKLLGRMSVWFTSGDPYLDNTLAGGQSGPGHEDYAARGTLVWQPQDNLDIITRLEHSKERMNGGLMQVTESGGELGEALFETYDPNAEYQFDDKNSNGKNAFNTDKNTFSVTINRDSDLGTLTSITAYNAFETHDKVDTDVTAVPILVIPQNKDFDQWSQELRLTSVGGSKFDYIAGLYFENADLTVDEALIADVDILLPGVGLAKGIVDRYYDQESTSWSVFLSTTWYFTDDLRLTTGFRYVTEDKKASLDVEILEADGSPADAETQSGFDSFRLDNDFDPRGDISEGAFLPMLSLQYDLSDELMVYTSASRGRKSGGFNPESRRVAGEGLGEFDFDPETANAVEIGFKATLFDKRMTLNTAIFHTQFHDLQVAALKSSSVTVTNAAEATSQGAEFDVKYLVNEEWVIGGSYSYVDATYDSFPDSAPTTSQIQAGIEEQDLSGERLQYAPEHSASLFVEFVTSLSSVWEFTANLDANFIDDFGYQQDNDPIDRQGAYTKFNGSLSFFNKEDTYEVSLVGKNLTDKLTAAYGFDVPVIGEFGFGGNYFYGSGAHLKSTDRPREIALKFDWHY